MKQFKNGEKLVYQSENSLFFPLCSLGSLRPQLSELFAVSEDEVHVFVEGLEGPNEGSRVLKDDPHPVVQVLVHLVAPADSHLEGLRSENGFGNNNIRSIHFEPGSISTCKNSFRFVKKVRCLLKITF